MVQGEAVRRRNLHGAAHCQGGALPVLNGSSGYNSGGGGTSTGGVLGRDVTEPWLVSAVAGLTGRM
jgi:hypothetical protein